MNHNIMLIALQDNLDVIGLKSLHYQLLSHGYTSHLLFIPVFSNAGLFNSVCNLVDKLSPLFVGMSLMSVEYTRALSLSRAIKLHSPSTPLIWGGIHPTIAPETCLEYADFVCVGEGERFIVDFAKSIANRSDPEVLDSLVYQRKGQVYRNALYPFIEDLSVLPICEHIPKNSYVFHKGKIVPLDIRFFKKFSRYSGTIYSIMSSRGCPFSCTYCCNNALAKIHGTRQVRFRDLAHVIEELKIATAQYPFIEYINFLDDCFMSRPDQDMDKFCQLYEQAINLPFIVRSIPISVTESKISRMKSAGLAWINLGLQSGSDRVCREVYRRRSGKQDFLNAAKVINRQDVAALYDVILDNPFEAEQDLLQTIFTLMETPKPFYTQFFSLSLYPGTELRMRALQEGLIKGDEYQSKDYLLYKKIHINTMVRLATFIPKRWMNFLLELYKVHPESLWFRFHLCLARVYSIVWAEPITYLQVIRLSQRKKLKATMRVLPSYMKEGFSRFLKQFG